MARATCVPLIAGLVLAVASPAAADSLSLVWNPSVDHVSGYVVYVRAGSASAPVRHDVGHVLSFTLRNTEPGLGYCFAVSAYLDPGREGPLSTSVCGYSNQAPELAQPRDQRSAINSSVSLQVAGVDPEGQPLAYSAAGLPPGLAIMESTGLISGRPSRLGRYSVTVSASDGVLSASRAFTWTVDDGSSSGGSSADTTAPAVVIVRVTPGPTDRSVVALQGVASDDSGVVHVTWETDRGNSGVADGTSNWSIANIPIARTTTVTVTAEDAAGNRGQAVLPVSW